MSVITITPDFATDVYPYTDTTDLQDMIREHVEQEIDSSLVYTSDIVDTWIHLGMPEPENADSDRISDLIGYAVYESLSSEDYMEAWYDSRDSYATTLLERLETISSIGWDEDASYTMAELKDALDEISYLDEDDAHTLLLEARDLINHAA